jgi:hypothetical protein
MGNERPPGVMQRKCPGELWDDHRPALAMLEAVLFTEGTVPQRVTGAFWRGTPPTPAHRALKLVDAVAEPDTQRWPVMGITFVNCGRQKLKLWSTGQA